MMYVSAKIAEFCRRSGSIGLIIVKSRHGRPRALGQSFVGIMSEEMQGLFHRPVGQEQSAGTVVVDVQRVDQHSRAAVDELVVGELHVDHAVAFHPSEAYHHRGREHVEDHFLARARLHP